MESSSTDTQQKVSRGYIGRQIDYWSKIDCIDCELSGYSIKYQTPSDLNDALGVPDKYIGNSLSLLRMSLNKEA
jgi:hypothetical protein